jgi:hypothetical protein
MPPLQTHEGVGDWAIRPVQALTVLAVWVFFVIGGELRKRGGSVRRASQPVL